MKPYIEKQRFNQWWLWLLFIAISCFWLWAIWQQVIQGIAVGEQSMSNEGLLFFAALTTALFLGILSLQLRTELTEEGFRVKLGWLWQAAQPWSEVRQLEIIHYGVAGMGLRLSRNYGTLLNMGSREGLKLRLKNGDLITIGTQQKKALRQWLEEHGKLEPLP